MQCPFCCSKNDAQASVCATCGRDIAVPQALLTERAELLKKRDELRSELERVKTRLGIKRRKIFPFPRA